MKHSRKNVLVNSVAIFFLGVVIGYFCSLNLKPMSTFTFSRPKIAGGSQSQSNGTRLKTADAANIIGEEGSISSSWQDKEREDKVVGEITDISSTGGVANGFAYRVRLTIKVGGLGDANYYFNEADLVHVKVFKLIDGQEQVTNLDELKSGDRVSLDMKTVLLKQPGSSLLEFKITKM